jgi:hypothetical protein
MRLPHRQSRRIQARSQPCGRPSTSEDIDRGRSRSRRSKSTTPRSTRERSAAGTPKQTSWLNIAGEYGIPRLLHNDVKDLKLDHADACQAALRANASPEPKRSRRPLARRSAQRLVLRCRDELDQPSGCTPARHALAVVPAPHTCWLTGYIATIRRFALSAYSPRQSAPNASVAVGGDPHRRRPFEGSAMLRQRWPVHRLVAFAAGPTGARRHARGKPGDLRELRLGRGCVRRGNGLEGG